MSAGEHSSSLGWVELIVLALDRGSAGSQQQLQEDLHSLLADGWAVSHCQRTQEAAGAHEAATATSAAAADLGSAWLSMGSSC